MQLAMLMRSLERALVSRRDSGANPIGGYDRRLGQLLDRAYSNDAALAVPSDKVHEFYDSMSNVTQAVDSINYMNAQIGGDEPSPRRKQELSAAAGHACSELVKARRIVGDRTKVANPISEHQPEEEPVPPLVHLGAEPTGG